MTIMAACRHGLAVTLSLFIAAPALAADGTGDAALGAALADRWCVSCHGSATRGSDAAPPLAQMLRGKGADETRLRTWLAAPHPPMQGLSLTAQQTEDVIAYLRRLARE